MQLPEEHLLREAGWRPGRSQDISADRKALESRGYNIGTYTDLFLREFTRLTINFTRNGRPDSIWFDGQRASVMADPEWVAHYQERTKVPMVPVGYANHEHLMLMQSEDGGFFGGFDDFLCALGSGADEMIANLLNQDREPLV
jgi:hypothetical protein